MILSLICHIVALEWHAIHATIHAVRFPMTKPVTVDTFHELSPDEQGLEEW